MVKPRAALFCIVVALFMLGCDEDPAANLAEGLKRCAKTSINSDAILYFGPSNTVGPGSVWREALDANGDRADLRLRFVVDDLPPPHDFVQLAGPGYSCDGGKRVSFELSAEAAAAFTAFPLNSGFSTDLKRAKGVSFGVSGLGWDQVRELAFEQYFEGLGFDNVFARDLRQPNRLVLYRALVVRDLTMDYEFSRDAAAELKAKYNGTVAAAPAEIGGQVAVTWTSGTTMRITAPGSSWILGELGKYGDGFRAAGDNGRGLAGRIATIPRNALVSAELVPRPHGRR